VAFIREKCQQREKAPEGWKTTGCLADHFGVDNGTVEKEVALYRKENPKWFQPYLDEKGSEREHLHPDFIKAFTLLRESRSEKAPVGWRTNKGLWNELSEVYSLDKRTVQQIAEMQLVDHPEWREKYLTPEGKFIFHYHPDLVEYIKKEVDRTKKKKFNTL
jgi:hypothetical protein